MSTASDEENARVSTAEAASGLTEEEEYLDLEHLDQGVQPVMEGLRPADPNTWERGRFYDPRDGGRYSVAIKLIAHNVILAVLMKVGPGGHRGEFTPGT